jgi:hypothetical protein
MKKKHRRGKKFSVCSAELHSAVSRIFNPRLLPVRRNESVTTPCRMQFGDTADFKSALRLPPNGRELYGGPRKIWRPKFCGQIRKTEIRLRL